MTAMVLVMDPAKKTVSEKDLAKEMATLKVPEIQLVGSMGRQSQMVVKMDLETQRVVAMDLETP